MRLGCSLEVKASSKHPPQKRYITINNPMLTVIDYLLFFRKFKGNIIVNSLETFYTKKYYLKGNK